MCRLHDAVIFLSVFICNANIQKSRIISKYFRIFFSGISRIFFQIFSFKNCEHHCTCQVQEPGILTGCSQHLYTGIQIQKIRPYCHSTGGPPKDYKKKQKYMITSTCYKFSFMSLIISRCSSFKAVDEFPAFIKGAERIQVKPLIIIYLVREPVYTGTVINYSVSSVLSAFSADLFHSLSLLRYCQPLTSVSQRTCPSRSPTHICLLYACSCPDLRLS